MKSLFPYIAIGLFAALIWSCTDDDIAPTSNNDGDTTQIDTTAGPYLLVKIDENPEKDFYLGYLNPKLEVITSSFGLTYTIEDETAPNAFTVTDDGFIYINDTSVFDYELNTIVTANVVVTKADVQETIAVFVELNDTYEPVFKQVAVSGDGFPARYGHEVIEFNNKLYVIGGYLGYTTGGFDSSVWVSDDVINWTKQPVGATHFPPRHDFAAVVFDSKLWVMGGRDKNNNDLNDIWYTSDGLTWNEVTVNGEHFSPREGHRVVVFNNQMVLTGGYDLGTNTRLAEVWMSSDGVNWTNETPTENMFIKRAFHNAVVFNNQICLLGGDETGNRSDAIWVSDDAINWTEVIPETDHFSHVSGVGVAIFKERIWYIGGYAGINGTLGEVWSCEDVNSWTWEVPNAMYSPLRFDHRAVVFNSKLYIFAGREGGEIYNDIWYFE